LLDNGIRIPDDLKVARFDDVKYAEYLSVPLTFYRQPCEEIGRIVVHTMLARFAQPDFASIRVNLQGQLIAHLSTSKNGAAFYL
jgi:DNA-binding LacI/PurR family transcriptional regulator